MQNYQRQHQSTMYLAVTLTVATGCLAQIQPASAQLVELATEALNTLSNSGQQYLSSPPPPSPGSTPQPSVSWSDFAGQIGTANLNGNTINLCLSGCIPQTNQPIQPPTTNSSTHLPIHFERL